jgi:predicted SAM-dependent methyltransferase
MEMYNQSIAAELLANYLSSPNEASSVDFRRQVIRFVVPASARPPLRCFLTRAGAPRQRWRAARLARERPIRLHLGSAGSHLAGWVNVDLVGDGADLTWDVTKPLPFADASISAIFHEHLLEHLGLPAAIGLLNECHRLLEPSGVLRVGVPDAGAYLLAYSDPRDDFLDSVRPGRPTSLLAIQEVFLNHGHRSAYDAETLSLLLAASGFRAAEERPFGSSRIEPCPDGPHRQLETLYMEACR